MQIEESSRMGKRSLKSCEEMFKNLGVLDDVFRETRKLFLYSQRIIICQRAGFVSYDFKG